MPAMSENSLGEPIAPVLYPPGWVVPDADETVGPKRPGTVVAAAIITWVCSAIVVIGTVSVLVFLVWLGEPILDSFDVSSGFVIAITAVISVWAIAACLLARWAMAGRNWARVWLTISAGATALASLVTVLLGLPLVSLLGASVVIALLFMGGANEWYRSQEGTSSTT